MAAKQTETVPETKADRRARIFDEARALISAEGFEGLSLRKLAARAGLTVPTIYNLIGGKDEILIELAGDMIGVIEAALRAVDEARPLERAEAVVLASTDEIARAPEFHRAALLAIGFLDRHAMAHADWDRLGRRAARMQEEVALAARRQGLLEGRISAELLGLQIFRIYQGAQRDWALRRISLEQFRDIALAGVYLNLAADASEAFRTVLVEKIGGLERAG